MDFAKRPCYTVCKKTFKECHFMRETILSAIARQKLVVILRGLPREMTILSLPAPEISTPAARR